MKEKKTSKLLEFNEVSSKVGFIPHAQGEFSSK